MDLADVITQTTKAKIIWYLREGPRKYSAIMKYVKERDSGKINYHLKGLLNAGLIKKNEDEYSLTIKGIKNALYVDSMQLKERYPIPIVLVAIIKNNKILLAKRSREPFKGLWGLPGNEILYGETPEYAAEKEIKEELKHNITDTIVYGSYPTIYKENEEMQFHTIIIAVKATCANISDFGPAKGKISEYKFFAKKELNKLKMLPTNVQPAIDAFSKKIKIKIQSV
jgi:8-oxo-dGTP diphosphatase